MTGAVPADGGAGKPVLDAAFGARLSEALGELPEEELLELAESVSADLDTVIADLKNAPGRTEAER